MKNEIWTSKCAGQPNSAIRVKYQLKLHGNIKHVNVLKSYLLSVHIDMNAKAVPYDQNLNLAFNP